MENGPRCGEEYACPASFDMTVITDDPTMRSYGPDWWDRLYRGTVHAPTPRDVACWHAAAAVVGDGSVVDLGCGEGWFAGYVRGDYLGVDWSDVVIGRARRRFPNREFAVADALGFDPGEGRRWDWAVAFELFEHLPEPTRLLERMRRIATAGAIVTLPRGEQGRRVVEADRRMTRALCGGRTEYHYAIYSEDYMKAIVPDAEFIDAHPLRIMFVLRFGGDV